MTNPCKTNTRKSNAKNTKHDANIEPTNRGQHPSKIHEKLITKHIAKMEPPKAIGPQVPKAWSARKR